MPQEGKKKKSGRGEGAMKTLCGQGAAGVAGEVEAAPNGSSKLHRGTKEVSTGALGCRGQEEAGCAGRAEWLHRSFR